MPCEVGLRNGMKLVCGDSHDELVAKIRGALATGGATRFVHTEQWDDYNVRGGGPCTLLVDEIASIVDKPTRPRI